MQWLDGTNRHETNRQRGAESFLAYVVTRGSGDGNMRGRSEQPGRVVIQEPPDSNSPRRGLALLHPEELPPGEVLVRVSWSSINHKDAMVTVPGNKVARTSPLVPGVDLAGVVVSSDDPAFHPGMSVLAHGHGLGVSQHGGFAELARFPAAWAAPLPHGLSARDLMVLGTAGLTSALSLTLLEEHGLRTGEGPVLVTGASGGVGSTAVALLASSGYEVVASTGKADEQQRLMDLGAARVIGRDALDEAPNRTLGPELWAGAIDCVGGHTLALVLRTLRSGAAVAASGLTGGAGLETTVYPFVVRGVALLGVDAVETPDERRSAAWKRLADGISANTLAKITSQEVSLESLGAALDDVIANRVTGRIVVRVSGD